MRFIISGINFREQSSHKNSIEFNRSVKKDEEERNEKTRREDMPIRKIGIFFCVKRNSS